MPNRLAKESSPYLLQHAENPVDWFPWSDEAFAKAQAEDKPVFLSIGYATCHWCHVMAHESFEDPEVAALMNDAFLNIKVDREERPDVDATYMAVCQALTGGGGWPLTILMTPDKVPFHAATYLPKRARGGHPGMMEFIPAVAEAWKSRREEIQSQGQHIVEHLAKQASSPAGAFPEPRTLDQFASQMAAAYDAEHGGFGRAPKFPTPTVLMALLRHHHRQPQSKGLTMVRQTLVGMRDGGIRDLLGGGWHRYSTDAQWLVPHFEKMLYDQALVLMALVETHTADPTGGWDELAQETIAYVERDLKTPMGAYASAEDADSEGVEGKYYVWSHDELQALLSPDELAAVEANWGVRPAGNYHDEATRQPSGLNILHQPDGPVDDPALDVARAKLLKARAQRVRPLLDDKVLTDWNGLWLAAVAKAARVLDDRTLLGAAQSLADSVLGTMVVDGRLMHRARAGEVGIPGFLEDHAFLAWGLIELHQATLDPRWLDRAEHWARETVSRFGDGPGALDQVARGSQEVLVRRQEWYDGALPSGNAVAMHVTQSLYRLTGEPTWGQWADALGRAVAPSLARTPSAHSMSLVALDSSWGPHWDLVVAPGAEGVDGPGVAAQVHASAPGAMVRLVDPHDGSNPEWLAAMEAIDAKTTYYACQGFACRQPTTNWDELLAQVSG